MPLDSINARILIFLHMVSGVARFKSEAIEFTLKFKFKRPNKFIITFIFQSFELKPAKFSYKMGNEESQ